MHIAGHLCAGQWLTPLINWNQLWIQKNKPTIKWTRGIYAEREALVNLAQCKLQWINLNKNMNFMLLICTLNLMFAFKYVEKIFYEKYAWKMCKKDIDFCFKK